MKTKDKKISPRKFYTLGEIVRGGLIPSVKTVIQASRVVATDKMRNRILDGVIVSRGTNGTQYKIKGSNIIKYLAYKDEQSN